MYNENKIKKICSSFLDSYYEKKGIKIVKDYINLEITND